ncbi:MAG: GNAT family N-acetyltransferase [Pseudonocardia sp.]|nr:GNAT family N-acetyltransferase [Pseudonocardia sp.]
MTQIVIEHCGADAVSAREDAIKDLYTATYQDVLDSSFHSVERFLARIRGYAKAPGFEFVLGSVNGQPVGLALGYPLPTEARWWRGLTTPVEPGLIEEDGTRTFALCELMIRPGWQGEGIGHRLHDELLFNRPERRATLLADEGNDKALQIYEQWGWREIGKLQPSWLDAPHFHALVLDLPDR